MVDALAIKEPGKTGDVSYCRIAMAQAARLILPAIAGVSPVQQLLNVPAWWEVGDRLRLPHPAARGRLQSPRRRGVAPDCPHGIDPAGMRGGTLVVFPAGFVLEPTDPRLPCVNVARSSVCAATFYRDAFDVTLSSGARFVVRTVAVDQVDSIFQAYFWHSPG